MQDLNDKVTGNSLTAPEWNEVPSEIQNVIEGLGITLSGADLNQLGKAIAGYVANGQFYTDGGAADAYVLSKIGLKQTAPAYTDGFRIAFFAANENTGASTINVAGLGVVDLVDRFGNALQAADVPTGVLSTAYYDIAAGDFVLDTWGLSRQITPIDASVAANALTVTIEPQVLEFRSSTLADGAIKRRVIDAAISMTVSSGSTLGTVNGVAARLAILAIDNAGTVELAVVNLAGGNNLDETTLISTTAEGGTGGADSANVIYSTTARSNVPFRVVGFIDITEATAGTWATGPTTVQGAGGNAITAMQSIGYGQTWQDVSGSRSAGVTYTNTTGRPIQLGISIRSTDTTGSSYSLAVNGLTVASDTAVSHIWGYSLSHVIPPGGTYLLTATNTTIREWTELR